MRRWKKITLWVLGVLLVLAVSVGALFYSAFAGRAPIRDGGGPRPGVHTVALGFVSAFFLDCGDGHVALVDAGADAGGADLLRALEAAGHSPSDVKAIFLTHGHGDHTAAVKRFPDADVYALEAERDLIAGRVAASSPVGRLRGAEPTGIELTRALADGESVQVGDLTVKVFAVPGHTDGSAAYLADETLFLGDAASAEEGGRAVEGPVWISRTTASRARNRSATSPRASRAKATPSVRWPSPTPAPSSAATRWPSSPRSTDRLAESTDRRPATPLDEGRRMSPRAPRRRSICRH